MTYSTNNNALIVMGAVGYGPFKGLFGYDTGGGGGGPGPDDDWFYIALIIIGVLTIVGIIAIPFVVA